jgi:DUF2075 family protein
VGVIIGPDLLVRDGKVVTNGMARSRNDRSIKGFKAMHQRNPEEANRLVANIIKNTYRTLMTRGMKSCSIYSPDEETRAYFKSRLS